MKRLVTTVCVLFLCSLFAPAVMGQGGVWRPSDVKALVRAIDQAQEAKYQRMQKKAGEIVKAEYILNDKSGIQKTISVIQTLKADDLEGFKRLNLPANGNLYVEIEKALKGFHGQYYVLDSVLELGSGNVSIDIFDIYARELPIPSDVPYVRAAVALGAFNIAKFLIKSGASVDETDMLIAKKLKNNKMIQMLSPLVRRNPASLKQEEFEDVQLVDENVLRCIVDYEDVKHSFYSPDTIVSRTSRGITTYMDIVLETAPKLLQKTPLSCYQYTNAFLYR